jgi:hypothetical protein
MNIDGNELSSPIIGASRFWHGDEGSEIEIELEGEA